MSYHLMADESVDFRIVTALRNEGLTVFAISENLASFKDEEVLRVAFENNSLLLTEDKDFGELVFRLHLKHSGILLLRLEDKETSLLWIAKAIKTHYSQLLGKFSVLNKNKLRVKE